MTDEPQLWQMVLVELYSLVDASGYRAISDHARRSGVAGPLSKSTVGAW